MSLRLSFFAAAASLALLTGCEPALPPAPPPQQQQAGATVPMRPDPPPVRRSDESRALSAYYQRLQQDLLARGLLRTDGGGPDTPYGAREILANFERIAFYDEYARGSGLTRASSEPTRLKRWPGPVRMTMEFGATVDRAQRTRDENELRSYARRLARVTRHPISVSDPASANFHVLVMGEDDRGEAIDRIRQLVPNIDPAALDIFRRLPRSIHCLVLAFSAEPDGYDYAQAIAFIRAEHPDLMRRSCIHEEVAQGLGLPNDSPRARPSIFNDDDEFALLTSHDEVLLRILYDPRLAPGMSLDAARPILRDIVNDLGQG
ncbi:MAG: DUF2927 domain-containing protein [Rhodosalinus sp.]